jgi:alkanesulfonate monooxygenase SsuD/methylene tetrahydromethanopterin reductase-like flavin-dependent oxidoreductase (luciferase family)
MTTLTKTEATLIQAAEGYRKRAFELLDQEGDPILISQDLDSAAEFYRDAALEIARRARRTTVCGDTPAEVLAKAYVERLTARKP